MKVYKTVLSAATAFFLTLPILSCGGSEVSGTFIPKEKNRIRSIEFRDGNARVTDSFLGIKQGCMEFDVKGDLIKIKHPFSGSLVFKIIDANTLSCEIPGMSGFYIRQK